MKYVPKWNIASCKPSFQKFPPSTISTRIKMLQQQNLIKNKIVAWLSTTVTMAPNLRNPIQFYRHGELICHGFIRVQVNEHFNVDKLKIWLIIMDILYYKDYEKIDALTNHDQKQDNI